MNTINRTLVEQCLIELSSREDQLRLWRSIGVTDVSSFSEALEQLFTDSGLEEPLHAGETGFGKECELCLIELEKALMAIDPHLAPDTLIASSGMEHVRKLAAKALVTLRTR